MPVTLSIDRNSQCNPTLWLIDVVPVAALQNRMPWPLLVIFATHSKGGVLFSAEEILQKSVDISTTTFWEETKCVWKMKLLKIWDHKCDSNNHWAKIGNSVSKHSAHFFGSPFSECQKCKRSPAFRMFAPCSHLGWHHWARPCWTGRQRHPQVPSTGDIGQHWATW